MIDTRIINCKIVTEDGTVKAGIGIDEGKIACIALNSHLPQADRTIDAEGNFVIPGLIDPHEHIGSDYPPSDKGFEDQIKSESASAAAGGITTAITFLNRKTSSYKHVIGHLSDLVEEKSLIDVGFHVIVNDKAVVNELPEYVNMGIPSAKFFMAYPPGEYDFIGDEGIVMADDVTLFSGFEALGNSGGMALVHAEGGALIEHFLRTRRQNVGNDLEAWTKIRPSFFEAESVRRASFLAKTCNVPLYIVHLSSAQGLLEVRAARNQGQQLFAETCPQYLTLTATGENMIKPLLGKINPPLRYREDIDALWTGLRDGYVTCIGADHAPGKLHDDRPDQSKEGKDIWSTLLGWGGSETILPLMLSEGVNKNRISIEDLVRVCCGNNAKVHGLWPQKGTIHVGSDADLVIVDLKKEQKLRAEMLHSFQDFTVWEGWTLKGWPTTTIARGNVVVRDGEVFEKENRGRFLRRHLNQLHLESVVSRDQRALWSTTSS